MPKELPIEYPIQRKEERLIISVLFVFLLLLTAGYFRLTPSRKSLIAKIPSTETDADFVIDEVYGKTGDIDALIIGPCTAWWQIYTPFIQEKLSEKYKRKADVITLGHNHFGSDLTYLLLKDVLKQRKVKNLILPLPKVEDLYPFPHQNSVNWWIYPDDLEGVRGVSFFGYTRILGLNLFSSIYRSSLQDETRFLSSINQELGFNSLRDTQRLKTSELPHLNSKDYVKVKTTEETDLNREHPLSEDWVRFYKLIFELAKTHQINLVFIDSPHATEFESDEATIPGNFSEMTDPKIPVIATDFKKWFAVLPAHLQSQIYAGHNLTAIGSQAFTNLIKDQLVEKLK